MIVPGSDKKESDHVAFAENELNWQIQKKSKSDYVTENENDLN